MANGVTIKKDELEKEKKWLEEHLTKNTMKWILENLKEGEIKTLVNSLANKNPDLIPKDNEKLKWLYECLTREENKKGDKYFLSKGDIATYRSIEKGKYAKYVEDTEELVTPVKHIVFEEEVIKGKPKKIASTKNAVKGKLKREINFPPEIIIGTPLSSEEKLKELVKELEEEKKKLPERDQKQEAAFKTIVVAEFEKNGDKLKFLFLFTGNIPDKEVYAMLQNPNAEGWKNAVTQRLEIYEKNNPITTQNGII
ncbi:MAG: hypothetical protein N3G76_01915, partial [Candidatus Micrarchaeota archaeon]|nr:hypothetical protein [Candidatus Micrarchaeota archaeon]